MEKISTNAKLRLIKELWHPHHIGNINDHEILLGKMKGEFIMHHHVDSDEFFFVLSGEFELHFTDKIINLKAGECIIVPKGTDHTPVAHQEVHVLVIHLNNTRNTGNIENRLTKSSIPKI